MLVVISKLFAFGFLVLGLLVALQIMRNSGAGKLGAAHADTLRVATYNAHYIILRRKQGPWSVGDWERRKTPMDRAFKAINADIIGFQEMESFGRGTGGRTNLALDWLLENNPDYRAAATGDPATFHSTQPIFYRPARLTMLDQGWLFFADTPDQIYARTFNGGYPAFASWAQFTDTQNGAPFRVINIHTDFASRSNRVKTAELVATRIAPWIAAGENVFLIGDLNARRGARTVNILQAAGLTFSPVRGATVHFNRGLNLFGAIDHIAYHGAVTPVGKPVVLRRKFDGEWPTDHYPVIADFNLTQP
jgi:endonuclease/exonuclease/phosphatase family metal-dependent hydrolase